MPRFNGQIHIRVTADVHKEVATEAFERGTSISGILAQALTVRRALKNIDPWKAIEQVQSANRHVSQNQVETEVRKAIKAVRRGRS
jgi:negative regulator of replication initiation